MKTDESEVKYEVKIEDFKENEDTKSEEDEDIDYRSEE